MKVAIYPDTKMGDVPADASAIHLVRPVDLEKIKKIVEKCGQCAEVSLSKSCFKRLPERTVNFFKKTGIGIRIESRRGRAIGIPLEKMLHAVELRKDYQSLREIERLTNIPKSTVHYLVKHAQRAKIKKGNATIYLK